MRITGTHVKFHAPYLGTVYYDKDLRSPLHFDTAVVQFGQHSYNPEKASCGPGPCAGTWHWDTVEFAPAVPFTMIKGDRREIRTSGESVTFAQPAPANAFIRYSGTYYPELSFDGGDTWVAGLRAPGVHGGQIYHADSFWQAVPEGVQSVAFRRGGGAGGGAWQVADFEIWSQFSGAGTPTPTPTASVSPSPTASATPTPTPTATPTGTVTFNDASGSQRVFNETYGGIVWSGSQWWLSGPYFEFTTKSVSFNGGSQTSGTFAYVSPKRLISMQALSALGSSNIVTVACAGQPTRTFNVQFRVITTLTLDWSGPCSSVTITSGNGWWTNFDNLVYD
jgi:hypothetical protein